MKAKLQWIFLGLIPVGLVVLGIFLYGSIPTSFLGLLCFCLAGLLCLYYGICMVARQDKMFGKRMGSIVTALVLFSLAAAVITGLFVGRAALGQPQQQVDYIVVLGAKVNGTQPSEILAQRIDAAYGYLSSHPDTVAVLSGGQGGDEGISEAECMFRALTARGIDPQRLLKEEASTSTRENLQFSLALLETVYGIKPEKIGIVSNQFHLFRAGLAAREWGVQAVGIPGDTANQLHFINYFLREIAGVWYYLILGG